MAMTRVILNVADVPRAVEFYQEMLSAVVDGPVTSESAVLDVVTAEILLRRADAQPSTWEEDDLALGFRHVGFKVSDLDRVVARLREAGVRFRAEPMDTGVGVRTAFFFDPDGTVLEVIEGFVDYTQEADPSEVAAERSLGAPGRPRFDHVASTVVDRDQTIGAYRELGFAAIGSLIPPEEPRGFRIDYLRSGPTILEVFSFESATHRPHVGIDTFGFQAVVIEADKPVAGSRPLGRLDDVDVLVDPDNLPYAIAPPA